MEPTNGTAFEWNYHQEGTSLDAQSSYLGIVGARESYFVTGHMRSHLREIPPRPKHPVMEVNIPFGIIQSWDPGAGPEVEANLTQG